MPDPFDHPESLPPQRLAVVTRVPTVTSFFRTVRLGFLVALLGALPRPSLAELVINEVDYDQPGTDSSEFIEILNTGPEPIDLAKYRIDLVNGATGQRYDSLSLPPETLESGDYFVTCTDKTHVASCDLEVAPVFHLIENGAPDAVAIALGAQILDTVSYEGDTPGYTEGVGTTAEDPPTRTRVSLARFPNGADTDNNDNDFGLSCVTPGGPNTAQSEECGPIGLELTVAGDCPGMATLHTEGGSGGGSGALIASAKLGLGELPGGPCSGTATDLLEPILLETFVFDVGGIYQIERKTQAGQCGWFLQTVDLSTCSVSLPASLP